MPRAFLIKKLCPGRDLLVGKRPWLQTDPENENTLTCPSQSLVLESTADTRGSVPYDLSVKQKKEKNDDQLPTHPIPIKPSCSVIEFSPKVLTSPRTPTPSIGVSLINPRIPSPENIKPCAPLEPLNLNTPPSSRVSSWHRPVITPCVSYFPCYHISHRATDLYSPPTPYIMPSGSSLISQTHLPLSPPRTSLRMEQLSPGLPGGRESSSLYSKPSSPPSHLHVDFPTICKQQPAYHHSSWIHMDKEGSISPIPRSDSSDSGSSSINNKHGSIVSSSTGGSGGVLAGQAPRYQCADCNKSYSTYSGLSRHRQFHCLNQVKKSFSCKYCEKVYLSLGALKMHIRTHTLPCKCKLCGKAFSRPWLLQGHIRTHTGEKPFACQHCSRAFADRSNLRAHLQTHSDVKKYNCKACTKTFSRMSLLLKHSDGGCLASQNR